MQGAAKNQRIRYKEVDHEKLHPPKGTLTTLSHKQAFTLGISRVLFLLKNVISMKLTRIHVYLVNL